MRNAISHLPGCGWSILRASAPAGVGTGSHIRGSMSRVMSSQTWTPRSKDRMLNWLPGFRWAGPSTPLDERPVQFVRCRCYHSAVLLSRTARILGSLEPATYLRLTAYPPAEGRAPGFQRSIRTAASRASPAPRKKGADGANPCHSKPAISDAGKSSKPSVAL